MLTSLTLTNFRGFTKLEIPRLAGVNLIGGVNNAGKTAILEAIFLLLGRESQIIDKLPSIFRAHADIDDQRYFWDWIAKGRDSTKLTLVAGNVDNKFEVGLEAYALWARRGSPVPRTGLSFQTVAQYGDRQLSFATSLEHLSHSVPSIETFSPRPTSPIEDAQMYIRGLQKSLDNEERIELLLHDIDARVKRVRSLSDAQTNKPLIHVGLNNGETFPATQFGQGFNRLLRIYSELLASEAEVFLIDEIETGLHHSVLETVWKGLASLAKREAVQIFATTHSRETILAAHKVFSAEPDYDFAYHRLERDADGEVRAVTYDQEALAGADEANFEVR